MFFSIIVPVYNAAHLLPAKIEMLLQQSFDDFEVIIIDDGSKDDTALVCAEYEGRDERLRIYRIQNSGSGVARNVGIEKARGKYLVFLDVDDEMTSNALENISKYCYEDRTDLIVFGHEVVNTEGQKSRRITYTEHEFEGEYVRTNLEKFFDRNQEYYIYGVPWNKVYRTDIVKQYSICFPELRRHQDQVFVLTYLSHVNNISFVSDVLYKYYAPNTFETEKKLPEDYFSVVLELDRRTREIVCGWNEKNNKIASLLDAKLIFLTFKACENMILRCGRKELRWKYKEFKEMLDIEPVRDAVKSARNMEYRYYQCMLGLLKKERKFMLFCLLATRVEIQKMRKRICDIRGTVK